MAVRQEAGAWKLGAEAWTLNALGLALVLYAALLWTALELLRAEPVAVHYANGRVRHLGRFAKLEDEMCALGAGGDYAGPGRSPDRADALVWALWALMGSVGEPRMRGM